MSAIDDSPPDSTLLTMSAEAEPQSFTLSFALGTGHRVNAFRCTPDEMFDPERLTRRELLEELDGAAERDGAAADIGSELSVRDVCKVDPQFSSLLDPDITVRGQVVLVNLGPQGLGALIMRSVCILLVTESSFELAKAVQRRLRRLLQRVQQDHTGRVGSCNDLAAASATSSAGEPTSALASKSRLPFRATALEAILLSASLVRAALRAAARAQSHHPRPPPASSARLAARRLAPRRSFTGAAEQDRRAQGQGRRGGRDGA